MEWINVKDKLPTLFEDVLLLAADQLTRIGYMCETYIDGGPKKRTFWVQYINDRGSTAGVNPTHWMHIPKLSKSPNPVKANEYEKPVLLAKCYLCNGPIWDQHPHWHVDTKTQQVWVCHVCCSNLAADKVYGLTIDLGPECKCALNTK